MGKERRDGRTKGETSLPIARWKEGRKEGERAVGFPPSSENIRTCQGRRDDDATTTRRFAAELMESVIAKHAVVAICSAVASPARLPVSRTKDEDDGRRSFLELSH